MDDGQKVAVDSGWYQDIFAGIMSLFERVGLKTGSANTNTVIFSQGHLGGERINTHTGLELLRKGLPIGSGIRGDWVVAYVGIGWSVVTWSYTYRDAM